MKTGKEYTISLIPYLQLVFTPIPSFGYGESLRLNKNHVGLQLDCTSACNNEDFVSVFGKMHYLQVSISGIYYPFYTNNDSWLDKCYITCGVSKIRLKFFNKKNFFFLGPLSIGYQGKILFFDVGISGLDLKSLFFYKEVKGHYIQSTKIGCSF